MSEAEIKGWIISALLMIPTLLAWYRKGEFALQILRQAIAFAQRQETHKPVPNENGQANANGNANGSRQMVDQALILALKSDSARLDITQDAIKRLDEKIEEYALKTQRMVDGVIFGMNDLKRATNERLGKMEIQMSELLTIARNGNGKHPPGDQPGDTKS